MSLLHSFYCWGAVGVILGSTLFFAVFGTESWQSLALIWAVVPLVNIFQFLTCPIKHLVEGGKSLPPCNCSGCRCCADDFADDLLRRLRSNHGAVGVRLYRVGARL